MSFVFIPYPKKYKSTEPEPIDIFMRRLIVLFRVFALSLVLALTGCEDSTSSGKTIKPVAPTLSLTPQSIKTFHFSWAAVPGVTEYKLQENADGSSGFTTIATIDASATSYDLVTSLPKRINASYILQACNSGGCTDSSQASVTGTLTSAIGYVKASNTEANDNFGYSVALSSDGNTLAVGAQQEDSSATGINGNETDNSAASSGAVYLY